MMKKTNARNSASAMDKIMKNLTGFADFGMALVYLAGFFFLRLSFAMD